MKFMTRARAGYLVTLAAGVAIGFTAVGTAVATPAQPARAHAVTHHYALAASAFAPDGLHTYTEDYFNDWDPTTLSNTDSLRCFNAGLSLPPGAKIKTIAFYYTQGETDSIYLELNRQNLIKHTSRELADTTISSNGSSPVYGHTTKSIKKAFATVNMGEFAYSVGACPDGDAKFSGIIITYTTG